jgi:hypothetical protein
MVQKVFVMVAVVIQGTDFSGHAKIANSANAHLVDENVFELEVPVD